MSKYIIKMKDGSEQHVMPAVHNTLKEALLTLSHYITGVVEDMDDDSMEDPFNYASRRWMRRKNFQKATFRLRVSQNL